MTNHFDGLDEKLTQSVEQPSEASTEAAPEKETGTETTETTSAQDLAKLGKFLFQGKEMTYEDLEKGWLRQQDYTKKTQALAEERKFIDNLDADLLKVRQNPSLASEFKKVYPENYHRFLSLTAQEQRDAVAQAQKQEPQVPNELLERLERVESSLTAKEKEVFDARLDSIEKELSSKYTRANLTDAYGAADAFMKENGIKPNQVDAKLLEPFFKASHEYNIQQYKAWQKEELTKQREASAKASDIGRGGGTPGEAPQRMKLKDVADHMINNME